MVRLHQFRPAWGLPSISPFCLKVDTYLRMAGIEYKTVVERFPRGPKGKLPFIDDFGKVVADSSFIIDYLKETRGDRLDADLSPRQRGEARAIQALIEEHLYFIIVHQRWIAEPGWTAMRPLLLQGLPAPIGMVLSPLVRARLKRVLHAQGLGRHTEREVVSLGQADLVALSDYLGDQPYFLGDSPRSLDACVYGFLANLLWPEVPTPLKQTLAERSNLVAYCERIRARYYPG